MHVEEAYDFTVVGIPEIQDAATYRVGSRFIAIQVGACKVSFRGRPLWAGYLSWITARPGRLPNLIQWLKSEVYVRPAQESREEAVRHATVFAEAQAQTGCLDPKGYEDGDGEPQVTGGIPWD